MQPAPDKKILLIDSIHPAFSSLMEAHGFALIDGTGWTVEEIGARIGDYNGVVIRSRIRMDETVLRNAGSLRFIARAGAGMENIDLKYAAGRNIAALHAPEGNRDAVGEHAIGMLLSLFNHLNRADDEVRRGIWKREENRGVELQGKTVGVIGFGNMGTAFVNKLAGFGVEVLVYDKYKEVEDGNYYRKASLDEITHACDVLSLHVPLTEETTYMVNDAIMSRFRKNFYLINTSRGKNVHTGDLVRNLKSGKVAGAALDVLEYETASFERMESASLPEAFQYLASSDRVILSPHIAGWTVESNVKIAKTLAMKILQLYKIPMLNQEIK